MTHSLKCVPCTNVVDILITRFTFTLLSVKCSFYMYIRIYLVQKLLTSDKKCIQSILTPFCFVKYFCTKKTTTDYTLCLVHSGAVKEFYCADEKMVLFPARGVDFAFGEIVNWENALIIHLPSAH